MFKTQNTIYKRMKKSQYGAFTTSDFLDLGNYKTISKSLELLEDEKLIKRARRGVYYLARFNKTLNIEVAPEINEVAKAIARQYNWDIVPSGVYALNIIGLSTQVPSKVVYISTGPYVKYDVGNNKIIFKHSTPKEISTINKNVAIAIQAMKEIGKENITTQHLKKIYEYLKKQESKYDVNKLKTTAWINDKLRRLNVQYS